MKVISLQPFLTTLKSIGKQLMNMIGTTPAQQPEVKTPDNKKQRILVFQQQGSGENKIRGIKAFGEDEFSLTVISIDEELPPLIDDTSEYLNPDFQADLVLDYLKHPDLSHDLSVLCNSKNIHVIASGKKTKGELTHTPTICCTLAKNDCLKNYGQRFGSPVFKVTLKGNIIERAEVIKGAPCGATWDAAKRIEGMPAKDAPLKMGIETQFFCKANPAGWDVMYGKSPVHLAGEIHSAALTKAIKQTYREE